MTDLRATTARRAAATGWTGGGGRWRLGDLKAPVLFLVGATASGKSSAAMAWARSCGGAILSMDAMQVYGGADVGTGKATAAERAEVPQGGLDLVEVGEAFSVADYLAAASAFLREQAEAGRRVMVVGGTGLYFRALTRGFCLAPAASEALHAELQTLSTEELRARLRAVDAPMLEQVDSSNPRRLIRAIEVVESTGKSLRVWQEETPTALVPEYQAIWLQRSKAEVAERIERRVEAMLAGGWREEVAQLVEARGVEAVRRFSAIGYRELAEVVVRGKAGCAGDGEDVLGGGLGPSTLFRMTDGDEDHRAALGGYQGRIVLATRQYAKRQLTWFARETSLQPLMASGHAIVPLFSL